MNTRILLIILLTMMTDAYQSLAQNMIHLNTEVYYGDFEILSSKLTRIIHDAVINNDDK